MVRISIKVKPNSKKDIVEQTGENQYNVRVKEKAIEGRANEAAIALLSKYFGVSKNNITVIVGTKNRNKIVAIR